MTILFMDGCDHYGASDELGKKWTTVDSINTYEASTGRFGGGCININQGDKPVEKVITASSEVILQFAGKMEAVGTFATSAEICKFRTGATQTHSVRMDSPSGTIEILRGTSTVLATSVLAISKDVWEYFEVKLKRDDSVGEFIVKVDGVEFINFSGDTKESTHTTVNTVQLECPASFNDWFIDDIIIMDALGAQNNDFIGDTRIETIYPTVDTAQADFTPLGAGTNFSEVDDGDAGPDDDTSHNESSTVGHKDLFTMGNLTTSNITTVHAVQTVTYAKKDDAGARTSSNLVKTGTTTDNSASIALGTDYTYGLGILELDPDTAVAWTEAGVNGAEVGYEVLT